MQVMIFGTQVPHKCNKDGLNQIFNLRLSSVEGIDKKSCTIAVPGSVVQFREHRM